MAKPRPPPKRKRRLTPADDESVRQDWVELERYYVEDLGHSRHQAHIKIGEAYTTSSMTVYRHLRYSRGVKTVRPKRTYRDHVQTDPNYRRRESFYRVFKKNPAKFVAPLFEYPEQALSIEEIALRLEAAQQYSPRLKPLEERLTTPHPRTGDIVLVIANTTPPIKYRLAEGLTSHSTANPKRDTGP